MKICSVSSVFLSFYCLSWFFKFCNNYDFKCATLNLQAVLIDLDGCKKNIKLDIAICLKELKEACFAIEVKRLSNRKPEEKLKEYLNQSYEQLFSICTKYKKRKMMGVLTNFKYLIFTHYDLLESLKESKSE